jgi:type II secretory pathway pseudopilin PulG
MSAPLRIRAGGFTYLAALFIIVIMGIMLGVVGQTWTAAMKREREEELLFRGGQIRDAITRWNKPRPGQHVATPLRELKDLLKDPRSLSNVRYLRRIYTDPVTGKEWNIIRDPVKGVIGVASPSEEKPLKQAGFPEEFRAFEGKTKYSEWLFVYGQTPLAGSVQLQVRGASGLP